MPDLLAKLKRKRTLRICGKPYTFRMEANPSDDGGRVCGQVVFPESLVRLRT